MIAIIDDINNNLDIKGFILIVIITIQTAV